MKFYKTINEEKPLYTEGQVKESVKLAKEYKERSATFNEEVSKKVVSFQKQIQEAELELKSTQLIRDYGGIHAAEAKRRNAINEAQRVRLLMERELNALRDKLYTLTSPVIEKFISESKQQVKALYNSIQYKSERVEKGIETSRYFISTNATSIREVCNKIFTCIDTVTGMSEASIPDIVSTIEEMQKTLPEIKTETIQVSEGNYADLLRQDSGTYEVLHMAQALERAKLEDLRLKVLRINLGK